MYSRAAWTFAFGFLLWFMNRVEYPVAAAKMFVALGVIAAAYAGAGWHNDVVQPARKTAAAG